MQQNQIMKDHRPHPIELYSQIWQRFSASIGLLWLFSQQNTQMADQLDREKVHEIAMEMEICLS